MKSIIRRARIALVVATTVAAVASPARGAIDFHPSIEAARKMATKPRPMVLIFGATWCGWCRKMAADTLTDPKVEAIAGKFSWVKIDVDKHQELSARFGVQSVPDAVVVDQQGRVLGARGGFIPADEFVEFLTKSLENPHPEEIPPDLLDRFVKADSPPARKEAAARVVEQLARPSRLGRDEMLEAVKAKGPSLWPVLLELMADNRLSVRAAAAGALKHASSAELPFQPFAPVETRKQQLAGWQKWLASRPAGS
jgi:thioredoxin-related protein